MINLPADRESIVRAEIESDGFRVHVRGWGSVPVKDRALNNHMVEMLLHAYKVGRHEAFADLRELIGAESHDY